LPEKGYGANVASCPARLHTPPDRLQNIKFDVLGEILARYVRVLHWKKMKLRNVMDM